MARILKIGNNAPLVYFTPNESAQIPNIRMGKHSNISTNLELLHNKNMFRHVNDRTMGALDNYAEHKGLSVYITPSHKTEAKDTLDISVYPKKESSKIKNFSFSTKLNNGRHSVVDFLTDLHKTITDGVKQAENKNVNNIAKPSKLKDFKMWCKNVIDRIKGNN